ncbi:glycosyl hydrolase family 8 [Ochrobactrum sp. EDr1-4]|uniref:glycosyl hydrolase family 8 n=1 Tax=Ochrobactrum sp. EDr1-4 TaxID=3368622 RepID=UPI003B9FB71E
MMNNRSRFSMIVSQWKRIAPTLAVILLFGMPVWNSHAQEVTKAPMTITANEWKLYTEKFLSPEGRIIDDANGNISHSEGQGYGLLLAVLAGRQDDFELIWTFTKTELLIRNDGLSAWKWDPGVRPHIVDTNNASDGDILIAYALTLAGRKWPNTEYLTYAHTIANTLLAKQIVVYNGETILLPAIRGFSQDDRKDGPIINLSYWVFEAFPVLNEVAPSPKWNALKLSGLKLLSRSRFGSVKLPSDWISLGEKPMPANGFPPEFSYNNVRIPLYLVRSSNGADQLTVDLTAAMTQKNGDVRLVNVQTDATVTSLSEPGYRILNELVSCAKSGQKISAGLKEFQPTHYYPSTLHLLSLAYIKEVYPRCL